MQHAQRLPAPAISTVKSLAAALPMLFVSTILSGAFLLFAVEPMFTKMLLPLFGGSPAVWNTALIFFQVTLLAGYAYAHVLRTRFSPLGQVAIHGMLAVGVLFVLPIHVAPPQGDPTATPILSLLELAAIGIGLPFFVLAANSSLLQSWYARYTGGSNPYVLFAASNLGSMIALIAYPLLIEPNVGLKLQSTFWGMGYALFALQLLGCAALMLRAPHATVATPTKALAHGPSAAITSKQIARWLVFAALPSSMMLGVTAYLEDEVAAIPLLWTLPLALYLLTFVIAFGFSRLAPPKQVARVVPYALALLVVAMVTGDHLAIQSQVALHLAAFFTIALYCHTTLNAERPPAARLTEFYLWVAVGGALGGIFNAIIAPQIFSRVLEYPIALVGGVLLLPRRRPRARIWPVVADFAFPALLAAALLLVTLAPILFDRWFAEDAAAFTAAILVAMGFASRPTRFGLALGAILIIAMWIPTWLGAEMLSARDFFGVKHVNRIPGFHALAHGGTLHGVESTVYGHERETLSYYRKGGPIDDIFRNLQPRLSNAHIAVTGLGIGTIGCYASPGQTWTYYEIDPQVVAIATDHKYFRYLSTCTPNAKIVLGDARLSLAREPAHGDALMILDAYTSDQPPLHLITKEAFDIYLAKLAPHGAIAIDISNRFFDLSPVLGNVAEAEKLVAFSRMDVAGPGGFAPGVNSSHWVVMARDIADLGTIPGDKRWLPLAMQRSIPLWTDDYSSLMRVWKPV